MNQIDVHGEEESPAQSWLPSRTCRDCIDTKNLGKIGGCWVPSSWRLIAQICGDISQPQIVTACYSSLLDMVGAFACRDIGFQKLPDKHSHTIFWCNSENIILYESFMTSSFAYSFVLLDLLVTADFFKFQAPGHQELEVPFDLIIGCSIVAPP